MKTNLQYILLALLFVSSYTAYSQSTISKKDSLERLLATTYDTSKVILLNKLSFEYLKTASYDKALKYSGEAFALSKKLGYDKGMAKSYINTGNVFLDKSEYDTAENYYHKALEVSTKTNNILIVSHCTNNLGEVYRRKGSYEKAIEYYMKSLRACDKLGDKKGSAETLNNVGLVYRELKNFPKAIESYNQAIEIGREIGDKYNISANLINLAYVYLATTDVERSMVSFQEALKLKEEIKDRIGVASCLMGIANVHLRQKNENEALPLYKQAYEIGKQLNIKSIQARCLNNIGLIYSRAGQYNKALEYHTKYLEIATAIGSAEDMRAAYRNLASDYANIQAYKVAYKHLRLYSELNDSLFNVKSSKQIAEMQAKYETEKKEKEIEKLKNEQALQAQINRNQKFLFGTSTLILAMGAAFLFVKKRNERTLLQEKIKAQQNELATIGFLAEKKNKTLADLQRQLEARASAEFKTVIEKIEKEIRFEDEWEIFNYHIERVHPGFLEKLRHVGPSLTQSELRLCAHFRTNRTTKEIAALSNLTIRAVQQAKYRIGQKLGHSGNNLTQYLKEL